MKPVGIGSAAVALFVGLGTFAGCGGEKVEGPPTIRVKGKIEFTKGGKALDLANRGVAVEFQSIEQPEVKSFGEILEDGSFTMATQVNEKGKPGVIAGSHRVRLNADESVGRFVSPRFFEYATSGITVKIPLEGELVIKVWK
jgi:hypothetical protein